MNGNSLFQFYIITVVSWTENYQLDPEINQGIEVPVILLKQLAEFFWKPVHALRGAAAAQASSVPHASAPAAGCSSTHPGI